jgi:AAA domain
LRHGGARTRLSQLHDIVLALADLDVQVITAPTVRLDLEADRTNLDETVAKLKPRLLVLDPFVRLHRIDENASGEVAPLLAYLRELQRHRIAGRCGRGRTARVVCASGMSPRRAEKSRIHEQPCQAKEGIARNVG